MWFKINVGALLPHLFFFFLDGVIPMIRASKLFFIIGGQRITFFTGQELLVEN